ncbi:MAG: hypothetical protein J5913_01330 [Prevotella sp.]|nr:hypothetical protein [Prevotella sp.]
MKKTILFLATLLVAGVANASIKNVKYATLGTPGGNATYDASTGSYSWTANNNNLMQLFSFENGELANYTKLTLKITATSGNVRVNFVYGTGSSDNLSYNGTSEGGYFGSTGTKEISLSGLETVLKGKSKTLSDVTAIRFGGDGSSNTGTWTIKWSDVYLENDDDAVLTALFGSIGGNASYSVPNYSCIQTGSNNLMDVYTGAAGDFSKYSNGVLQFTISDLSSGNMVRVGYHNGSSFSEFGSGFGSSGTKTVDISAQSSNAAAATMIKFGAKSGTAASPFVTIRPDQMYLVRSEAYTREFTQDQKSTVWLPFALTAEEVAAVAGKFYELTAADGASLTFTEVTGATEAYKPYVFVASSTGTPFSGMKSKTIVAPKACSYTVGDYTFVGSMKDTTVPNGAYGYNSTNGAFSKTKSDAVTIAPFRAYITYNGGAGARELNCIFSDDETTGIETVRQGQQQDGVMYNLQGQRVGQSHKGLFIMNGRKYVVK